VFIDSVSAEESSDVVSQCDQVSEVRFNLFALVDDQSDVNLEEIRFNLFSANDSSGLSDFDD
jgi:hypothetical protein